MSIIDSSAAVRDLGIPPPLKRCEQHEQIGGAVAFVFVVNPLRASLFHRDVRSSSASCGSAPLTCVRVSAPVAWRSRPGKRAGFQDRAAAYKPPAPLPWLLRMRHWPPAG